MALDQGMNQPHLYQAPNAGRGGAHPVSHENLTNGDLFLAVRRKNRLGESGPRI
jgi:hypothetical protein